MSTFDRIRAGIIEILWAMAWADHVEECGCQSLSGQEITEIMPTPPKEAEDMAGSLIVQLNKAFEGRAGASHSLVDLYLRRVEQAKTEGTYDENRDTPERFGNCIAFETMGSGVSWADDHESEALDVCFHFCADELTFVAMDQCAECASKRHDCKGGTDYRGRCLGPCPECGDHLQSTGRYTVYCPSCNTCPECSCPEADGFSHYAGCSLVKDK